MNKFPENIHLRARSNESSLASGFLRGMRWFSSAFAKKPRAARLIGYLVVSKQIDQSYEEKRIKRIIHELRASGTTQFAASELTGNAQIDSLFNEVIPLQKLPTEYANDFVVMCPTSQYHVTNLHLKTMISAARLSGKTSCYQIVGSEFIGNMGLHFCIAVLAPQSASINPARLGYLNFWNEQTPFDDETTVNWLEISDAELREAYRSYAEIGRPKTVTVELNSTCNFKCSYCPFHGDDTENPLYVGPKLGREMCLEDFAKQVRSVAEWKDEFDPQVATIAPFWRGEFFMAGKWQEALAVIKENGLRSYVCTNGSVLRRDIVDTLMKTGLLDHLTISLDATDDEQNWATRRNAKFDRIQSIIEYALSERARLARPMTIALNFTIVTENKEAIEAYVEQWGSKVDYILMGPRHKMNPQSLHGEYEQDLVPWEQAPIPMRRVPCVYLVNTISVNCDQEMHLCAPCGSQRIEVANVSKRGIAVERSESVKVKETIKSFEDGSFENNDYCRNCSMWRFHFQSREERMGYAFTMNPQAWTITRKQL